MKRLSVLILNEMLGPWLFGVAIFTVLIMAGSWLFKLTDFIVQGVGPGTIMELTFLLLPGVMAKTFPMAVLLSALLSFGRLSSDSEIVALKAAGTSLGRMVRPVALFGLGVSAIAFGFNELLVPAAALRATVITKELEKNLSGSTAQSIYRPIYDHGRLVATVQAQDFNFTARLLRGAQVTVFGKDLKPTFYLFAHELMFTDEKRWRMRGGGELTSRDGSSHVLISEAWPEAVPIISTAPEDLLAAQVRDLDSFSMSQIQTRIQHAREDKTFDPAQLANLQFGYWNKLAVPLAALVFALVGAPLGIRNHRTGAAAGFWLSVIIIFAYMMLANFMAIYAQGRVIPAYLASFTPLILGLVFAAVTIHRKNM